MELEGPTGVEILLADASGYDFANIYYAMIFEDNETAIASYTFNSWFIDEELGPFQPLYSFYGQNANGLWTLVLNLMVSKTKQKKKKCLTGTN